MVKPFQPSTKSLFHSSAGVDESRASLRFAITCSLSPIPVNDVVCPGVERAN